MAGPAEAAPPQPSLPQWRAIVALLPGGSVRRPRRRPARSHPSGCTAVLWTRCLAFPVFPRTDAFKPRSLPPDNAVASACFARGAACSPRAMHLSGRALPLQCQINCASGHCKSGRTSRGTPQRSRCPLPRCYHAFVLRGADSRRCQGPPGAAPHPCFDAECLNPSPAWRRASSTNTLGPCGPHGGSARLAPPRAARAGAGTTPPGHPLPPHEPPRETSPAHIP